MAVGDIVQAVGTVDLGVTSVAVSGSVGQPSVWATPTSGNTLVALVHGDEVCTGVTGFTQRYSAGTNEPRKMYDKTSDGTETTITASFGTAGDALLVVYEIEGDVTFDVAASDEATAVTEMDSGATATLGATTSVALAFCQHWVSSDTAFDSAFVLDLDYSDGDNGDLYYLGAAHKSISGTTGVSTTGSWTGSADASTMVGVWSVSTIVYHDGAATPTGVGTLAATGELGNTGTATLTGSGTLSATGHSLIDGAVATTGLGTMAATGLLVVPPDTWPGYGEAYGPAVQGEGTAVLVGVATLAAAGAPVTLAVFGPHYLSVEGETRLFRQDVTVRNLLDADTAHHEQSLEWVELFGLSPAPALDQTVPRPELGYANTVKLVGDATQRMASVSRNGIADWAVSTDFAVGLWVYTEVAGLEAVGAIRIYANADLSAPIGSVFGSYLPLAVGEWAWISTGALSHGTALSARSQVSVQKVGGAFPDSGTEVHIGPNIVEFGSTATAFRPSTSILGDVEHSGIFRADWATRAQELMGNTFGFGSAGHGIYTSATNVRFAYRIGVTNYFDAGQPHGLSDDDRARFTVRRNATTGDIEYFVNGVSVGTSSGTAGALNAGGRLQIGSLGLGVGALVGEAWWAETRDGFGGPVVAEPVPLRGGLEGYYDRLGNGWRLA